MISFENTSEWDIPLITHYERAASMSRMTFETKAQRIDVDYSEWYFIAELIEKMTNAILAPQKNRKILLAGIPSSHILSDEELNDETWVKEFYQAMEYEGDGLLRVKKKRIDETDLRVNTVLATGSDAMKMATMFYAKCSTGAYVRGENRAWMANIIEDDNAALFRPGHGWEEVVTMLRKSTEETVFFSFDGSGDGGNWDATLEWIDKEVAARGMDPEDWETEKFIDTELRDIWESMEADKQWEIVEAWMVKNADKTKEISPELFSAGPSYGDGMDAGKLMEILKAKSNKTKPTTAADG